MSAKQPTPRLPTPPPNRELPSGGIAGPIAILALCIAAAVIGFLCTLPAGAASMAPRAPGGVLHGIAYAEEHEGSAIVGLILEKGNSPRWVSSIVHPKPQGLDPDWDELVIKAMALLSDEASAFFSPFKQVTLEVKTMRLVGAWPGDDISGGDEPARFIVALDAVLR